MCGGSSVQVVYEVFRFLIVSYHLQGLRIQLAFFFFKDTAPTGFYTLSLHDALPISKKEEKAAVPPLTKDQELLTEIVDLLRSEEHTSELQSRQYLVCRLLLEKKKNQRQSGRSRA